MRKGAAELSSFQKMHLLRYALRQKCHYSIISSELSSAQQLQAACKRFQPLRRIGKSDAFDCLGCEIAGGELRLVGGEIIQAAGKLRESRTCFPVVTDARSARWRAAFFGVLSPSLSGFMFLGIGLYPD